MFRFAQHDSVPTVFRYSGSFFRPAGRKTNHIKEKSTMLPQAKEQLQRGVVSHDKSPKETRNCVLISMDKTTI
jgi:hypothetical protein